MKALTTADQHVNSIVEKDDTLALNIYLFSDFITKIPPHGQTLREHLEYALSRYAQDYLSSICLPSGVPIASLEILPPQTVATP